MLVTGGVYHIAPDVAVDGEAVSLNLNQLGELRVVGSVADDAAMPATTFPIWMGGIYRATLPTYTAGDSAGLHTDVNGRLLVREDTLTRGAGAADADTLRVVIANDTFALDDGVTTANTIRVTLANDDFQQGAGAVSAQTQRVTIATDDFTKGAGAVDATTLRVQLSTESLTNVYEVQGDAADNAVASGNPVRSGGIYNAAPPTYDDGDATTFQMDVNGRTLVNARSENRAAQTVKSAQVPVGVAPAIRITHDGGAVTAGRSKLEFMPDPDSSARFYYGALGVLITTGKEVFPGQTLEFLNDENEYYIVSDTPGQTFHVVEVE
jgi:hypothetical protein